MKKIYGLFVSVFLLSTTAYTQVDYASEIQSIFNASCNSCHNAGQNSFNSSSYAAVMASTSPSNRYNSKHVLPGNADGSPLVDKIEPSPQFGGQMPVGGSLSQDQINKIKAWINEGANQVVTSNEEELGITKEFKLVGNYPNPFNPSTTVQFETPVSVQYTLSVFTISGQLVKEQVGTVSSGIARVTVDFLNQPSGMYIYRLRALASGRELFFDSGIMTLIK